MNVLSTKGNVSEKLKEKISNISDLSKLTALFNDAVAMESIADFEKKLAQFN